MAVLSRHTQIVSGITHDMSDNPLIGLFSSRPLVRLLCTFLMNPRRRYYQQELVRLTGDSLRPVQLALEKLQRASLISRQQEGRQVYYQAVVTHPAFNDLRSLFAKTFALADVLRDSLAPIGESIEIAFVHGSVASGEERATSDVDLLVIGAASKRALSVALAAAEDRLAREVNVSLYTPSRFAQALVDGDPFINQVLTAPRIWLVGDEVGLERLAR